MAKPGDILGQMNEENGNNQSANTNPEYTNIFNFNNKEELEYLKSIDATLKQLLRNGTRTSQSNARNQQYSRDDFRDPYNRNTKSSSKSGKSDVFHDTKKKASDTSKSFVDSFEKAFLDGIVDSGFKKKMSSMFKSLADYMGVELEDIPGALGKEFGTRALNIFKETDLGKNLTGGIDKILNAAGASLKSQFEKAGVDFSAKDITGSAKNQAFVNSFRDNKNTNKNSAEDVKSSSNSELAGSALDDILAHVANIHAILDSQYVRAGDNEALQELYGVKDMWKQKAAEDVDNASQKVTDLPIDDMAGDIGTNFGSDKLGDVLKNSKLGGWIQKLGNGKLGAALEKGGGLLSQAGSWVAGKVGLTGATSTIATAAGAVTSTAGTSAVATGLAGSLSGLSAVIPEVGVALLALKVGTVLLKKAFAAAQETVESLKKHFAAMSSAANRETESRKKNQELAQKRLEADVDSLIRAPFKILEDAAQKVYDAWDANVRLINGTQGYDKSDLQNLMGQFGERLRSEGLSSVIGATDVTESLAKVLQSGLSGKAAEEFAYLATKLNAAIPSQDFFGYADEYASVAANMVAKGYSQSEALAAANSQLESFASSLLYSSRTLTGGFTTGLQNAEQLYSDAVKISQAAKTGDTTNIASVLTAVSAITGAVAPDLASSMTDAIVSAATGGNSSEIVALRSLAGINASNTEFLRALANDPQSVFETLFTNLADLQNMSRDSYMEVAEGLSSVFGISMDAFARIDFNQLSDAIRNMNTSNKSLEENLKQLASGETTTTAEQLRLAQINEYMIDEGLAYVLDNEVARSIQEHMWDEQIARELMEASYAVELKGSGLELLESLRNTVEKITAILNPFQWMKKISNLVGTAGEGAALGTDIQQSLLLGRVGNGKASDLKNLITRNADLNLTNSYIELLGGLSAYSLASGGRKLASGFLNAQMNPFAFATNTSLVNNIKGTLNSLALSGLSGNLDSYGVRSNYSWGSVSKSDYSRMLNNSVSSVVSSVTNAATTTAATATTAVSRLNEFLATQNEAVAADRSYEDWVKDAKKYGISNLSDALEDAGLSEADLKNNYGQAEGQRAAEQTYERYIKEEKFWERSTQHYDDYLLHTINEHQPEMETLTGLTNSWLEKLYKKHNEFYNAWVDYFVKHTVYNESYSFADVEKIKAQSKSKESGDLVNALAEALVKNTVDLKDPQVQTNALLSQILIVAQSIMQQNNKTSSSTISSSLVAQALGI